MTTTDQLAEPLTTIVRSILVDELSLGTDVSDNGSWPVIEGTRPNTPDDCLVVTETTGVEQGRHAIGGARIRRYGAQIQVRSARYTTGDAKARAISLALTETVNLPLSINSDSGTGRYFVWNISIPSGPIHLGNELDSQNLATKRHLWSINILVSLNYTTS